jgi:hypothetical protein
MIDFGYLSKYIEAKNVISIAICLPITDALEEEVQKNVWYDLATDLSISCNMDFSIDNGVLTLTKID